MADLLQMYEPQAGSPETSTAGALTASGTTVNVADGSVLPQAPNLLTLGAEGGSAETVLMTAKTGNTITITRGQDGTAARAWPSGTTIGRYFTAHDQSVIQTNITRLNSGKMENPAGSPAAGNLAVFETGGKLKDSNKKPADFATAAQGAKADTALQPVLSPTADNFAAIDAAGKIKDSNKKPADFATAAHNHPGYAQVKIYANVAVAASAWASDSTYAAYPFAAAVSTPGVTADMVPEVSFGLTEAASGIYAPVVLSGAGTVKIYASAAPAAAITIASIICVKAVG